MPLKEDNNMFIKKESTMDTGHEKGKK